MNVSIVSEEQIMAEYQVQLQTLTTKIVRLVQKYHVDTKDLTHYTMLKILVKKL